MTEKDLTANNERESKKTGFAYAVQQLEIMRKAIHDNNDKPVAVFLNRQGEREYLLLDKEFLCAMAGGVAGFYVEMKQFGMRDVAEKVLEDVLKDDI